MQSDFGSRDSYLGADDLLRSRALHFETVYTQ
jgi:hypothetical protein